MQSNQSIQLIVGLGNPGTEYENTKHNAGVWFLQNLANRHDTSFHLQTKFKSHIAKISIAHQSCHLLIPNTYMNDSGLPIRLFSQFYQLQPSQILVAHDELDLPPGMIRLKTGGGHGGHNGLRDTIKHLGSNAFHRLRIGIGHPGHKDLVTDYVLSKPKSIDARHIEDAIDDVIMLMPDVITGHIQTAMKTLHTQQPTTK